jgi:dolichol-phosphate mannosyltransferase
MTSMTRHGIAIFVPTYNERENVEELCRQILALGLDADLVFLDDNSPDGTGQVLDQLAAANPNVRVLHREGKQGIGSAHLHGIDWAYEQGYRALVTMDCDFTHSPSDIPRALETLETCDVAVGSRFLRKGSLPGWKLSRKALTLLGHFVTKFFLGVRYDSSGAFRAYRLDRIPRDVFGRVMAKGYAFFLESMLVLTRNRLRIRELAIQLPARTYGHSKMSWGEIVKSVKRLVSLYTAVRLTPLRFEVLRSAVEVNPALSGSREWDEYWSPKARGGRLVYDVIASVYRRCVIRRRLAQAIAGQFAPGAELLHAGCGGGEVDADARRAARVTAVDYSVPALRLYLRHNPGAAVRHASILDLPMPDESFDGVYNLGVMEHFSADEIAKILREFRRVLRPGGKVVFFWPHARGASVQVLKLVHGILSRRGRHERLHAPEISLMESRRQAVETLARAGFRLTAYTFGMQDMFVQAIVVGQKA